MLTLSQGLAYIGNIDWEIFGLPNTPDESIIQIPTVFEKLSLQICRMWSTTLRRSGPADFLIRANHWRSKCWSGKEIISCWRLFSELNWFFKNHGPRQLIQSLGCFNNLSIILCDLKCFCRLNSNFFLLKLWLSSLAIMPKDVYLCITWNLKKYILRGSKYQLSIQMLFETGSNCQTFEKFCILYRQR